MRDTILCTPMALASPLLTEHGGLLAAIDPLLDEIDTPRRRFLPGRRSEQRHNVFADRVALLGRHLNAARALTYLNEYSSAYVVLRAALEHHLLDRLLFLATRYRQRYPVPTAGAAAEHARLAALQASTRPDIRRWKYVRKHFEVIVSGLHETGRIGKPPTLSPYYFSIERYDPFVGRPETQRALTRQFLPRKLHRRAATESAALWKGGFSPHAVLENLKLNRLLTRSQAVQVAVQYAFLSAYAHATQRGYDLVSGRTMTMRPAVYDHYSSELGLLYIAVLASQELRFFERALARPPRQPMRNWHEVEAMIAAADAAAAHLWFLIGGPTDLDRWHEANARNSELIRRGGLPTVRPASLADAQNITTATRSST